MRRLRWKLKLEFHLKADLWCLVDCCLFYVGCVVCCVAGDCYSNVAGGYRVECICYCAASGLCRYDCGPC